MNLNKQSLLNKAKDDKFILVLNMPAVIRNNNQYARTNTTFDFNTLQFAVQGTVVPKIEVPSIETRFGGATIPISSHARPTYAPLMLTFKIDSTFSNYWSIFFWLNALRDQEEGIYGIVDVLNNFNANSILADYSTDFSIFGLGEYNDPVIKFTYRSAFPTSLSEIKYDYQNNDEIQATVEFAFRQLNIDLVDTEKIS